MSNEKVMNKVRKLLALSQSDNEHEAHLSLAMAQKLCLKNDIDIDYFKQEKEQIKSITIKLFVRKLDSMTPRLLSILTKNFNTSYFIVTDAFGSKSLRMHGNEVNIEAFKMSYFYILGVYKRAWSKYHKKVKNDYGFVLRDVRESFKHGFLDGIDTAFQKNIEEYGIVLCNDRAVAEKTKVFNDLINSGYGESKRRTPPKGYFIDAESSANGFKAGVNYQNNNKPKIS